MKNIAKIGIIFMVALLAACQSEYDVIENGVFLTDAQKSQSKKVTIDDTGAKTVISSRLGTMMTTDVTVEYGTDATALQAYNQKNGTDYQLLPEKFYSFSESTTTIKAGEIGSSPTNLIIKPFDETIDATKKYAIPVAIVNANGAEKLLSSSSLIVLLDQIIVTTVPYLANGNAISIVPESMIEGLSSWTLEWNLCMDAFNRNNAYMVTNGTSTANKIVGMYSAPAGSTILIDRNCHKSLTHLMMMSDVTPIYFRPTRNAYGILGGIPQSEFQHATIAKRVKETPNATWPVHAVITNSTYDGLLYNTDFIKKTLDVKSIHFDSAWVPYTNFSPIYEGKCGMSGGRVEGKVIYETQSTHKLLAAFSQASMIHVKGDVNEETFNEAYMMHTTTSPHYGIVASTETAAAMMKGNAGKRLINGSIERAIKFRKEIKRLRTESDGWFFDVWQPDHIDTTECWPLRSDSTWHGFKNIDNEHMYLDPIKVTLLTPGMEKDGTMSDFGIPASIVAKYLDEHGIVVEKTGPYNLLFLFSIGIDKTKALSLLRALTDFKRAFDLNLRVKNMLPSLYREDPEFYENMRIQELAQNIHKLIVHHNLPDLMYRAFEVLPTMVMTPYAAFQKELHGMTEEVYLDEMVGRINANMILPYPPGVPLVMPGEMITEESRPVLEFLQMLCEIGAHYPGFETDIHGAYRQADGRYTVKVLKEESKK